MKLLLDHSIVGQTALSNFTFRKDRPYAGCRLCGDLFQPRFMIEANHIQYELAVARRNAGEQEIVQWREQHNLRHTAAEHLALAKSGLTFTPEAALKMAPFGLVPIADAEVPEIAQALREAPRAPVDDVDSTLKGY